MSFRCAILDDYQGVALDFIDRSQIPIDVELVSFSDHLNDLSSLSTRLQPFDAVILMRERTPCRAELLKTLPGLKLIITTGMRNTAIDMAAARDLGITVCGTASFSEPPTELTWALILAARRQLCSETQALAKGGAWQSHLGEDLYGSTIGLIGLGKIGTRMVPIAKAFGMQVLAWSPHLDGKKANEVGVEYSPSLDDLLGRSDVVSVHLGLGASTEGIITSREFSLMKSTALFVNTSRAGIVAPGALLAALDREEIAGAAVDVFEQEPLPTDAAYLARGNLLASPHLGYVTRRNYTTYYRHASEDIAAFLAGQPVRVLNDGSQEKKDRS